MEIGNYYAGYRQINNLFNDFADARIYRRRGPATDADERNLVWMTMLFASLPVTQADGFSTPF